MCVCTVYIFGGVHVVARTQATVAQLCRFPQEDHEDTPMTDPSNLAEICTQNCGAQV